MPNYRKLAKGQPCMVRVPGVCDGGGETTVLAHYRLAGSCGVGIKPDDYIFGAWCCWPCHEVCDGRVPHPCSKDELRLYHAEGVMRTQEAIRGKYGS